jgi:hypothetical protein
LKEVNNTLNDVAIVAVPPSASAPPSLPIPIPEDRPPRASNRTKDFVLETLNKVTEIDNPTIMSPHGEDDASDDLSSSLTSILTSDSDSISLDYDDLIEGKTAERAPKGNGYWNFSH